MAEIRAVLTTPEVPTLLTTSMIGRLPTAMATLGVLLLIHGQGGDYTLAGGLAAMFTAGTVIGQPTLARMLIGAASGRCCWPRRPSARRRSSCWRCPAPTIR